MASLDRGRGLGLRTADRLLAFMGLAPVRYRRAARIAGTALGALTVTASVFAGLPGPLAIAACAVVLSLPVSIAWRRLALHG